MRTTRFLLGTLISPILALTGFRFSKDYRWGVTPYYRAVYALVDTVSANLTAQHLRRIWL